MEPEQKKTEKVAEDSFKPNKSTNIWMFSTFVLVVIVVIMAGFSLTGYATGGKSVSSEDAGKLAKAYIEKNLLPPGSVIIINNVTESNGVYLLSTDYMGRAIPVYMTKDSKYIFLSAVDITKPVAETTAEEIPKTDKPTVELFVMSFCPYGLEAENIMKPVADLLGSKADFKVRFIVNVNGDTMSSVDSLHGANEALEDAHQLCIMKNQPGKYWDYLMEVNKNCPSVYRTGLDACWKAAANKTGVDIANVESCVNSTAVQLLTEEEQAAGIYGVSGSPTLIINGVQYSGGRTSEEYKSAICDAFTTAPAECSTALGSASTSTSTDATGGCAA